MASITQTIRDNVGALATQKIHVDAWGIDVTIQRLDGVLLETWEEHTTAWVNRKSNTKIDKSMRAVLIALSIVDEQMKRPFNTPDGISTLSGADNLVLKELFDECQRFNRLGRWGVDDEDPEGDVVKNEEDATAKDSDAN